FVDGGGLVALRYSRFEVHETCVAVVGDGDRCLDAGKLIVRLAAPGFHDCRLHVQKLDACTAQRRASWLIERIDTDTLPEHALGFEIGNNRCRETLGFFLRALRT